jgi:hypothetical protein
VRTLEAEKLLWVMGEPGVRNYVALSLAITEAAQKGEPAGVDSSKGARWAAQTGVGSA